MTDIAALADRIEQAGAIHIPLPLSEGGGLTNLLTEDKNLIITALRAMADSKKIRDALDKMAKAHPTGAVLREQRAAEARGYARGKIEGYAAGIADAAKARTPEPPPPADERGTST